jgi:hypothetical protein
MTEKGESPTRSVKLGIYGVGIGAMAAPDSRHIAQLAEELGYESL